MAHKERPKTQVSVYGIIVRGNAVLMSERKNSDFWDGWYSLPAGRLEYGETVLQGLKREMLEELGITVDEVSIVHTMHRKEEREGGYECIDFFFVIEKYNGDIINMEQDKCWGLSWIDPTRSSNVVPYVSAALSSISNCDPYSEYGW